MSFYSYSPTQCEYYFVKTFPTFSLPSCSNIYFKYFITYSLLETENRTLNSINIDSPDEKNMHYKKLFLNERELEDLRIFQTTVTRLKKMFLPDSDR